MRLTRVALQAVCLFMALASVGCTRHLTPTLKLKRSVIAKDFAAEIESLYAGRG